MQPSQSRADANRDNISKASSSHGKKLKRTFSITNKGSWTMAITQKAMPKVGVEPAFLLKTRSAPAGRVTHSNRTKHRKHYSALTSAFDGLFINQQRPCH